MIVLNLSCDQHHGFEGWFASADAFDAQAAKGLLSCPVCQSLSITRLPSGPRVLKHDTAEDAHSGAAGANGETAVALPGPGPGAAIVQQLMKAVADLAGQAEDVSERFPEEARRIHYGEAPARTIRGKASLAETAELLEEGISVLPIPFPDKDSTH